MQTVVLGNRKASHATEVICWSNMLRKSQWLVRQDS